MPLQAPIMPHYAQCFRISIIFMPAESPHAYQRLPIHHTYLLVDVATLGTPPKHWVRGGLAIDGWLTVNGEDSMVIDVGQLLREQAGLTG